VLQGEPLPCPNPSFYPLTRSSQCGEVGHIARNCSKGGSYGGGFNSGYGGGGGFGGQKTCYSCGGIGHLSRKPPTQSCFPARSRELDWLTEHLTGDCVNGNKCYNCGVSGHLSRDCPKESTGGEKICYKCQQAGHVQSQCPNN
jgi:cellular nucleic acid-binding protein